MAKDEPRLHVRITKAIEDKVTADADAQGMDVSSYVRMLIMNAKVSISVTVDKGGK